MGNIIIDLTHTLNKNMTVYPDTVLPIFESYNTIEKDGFAEIKMSMSTHTGTHIDAPCHLLLNSKSLDQFPINKFIGKAIVIPCQDKKEISLEYLLTFKDVISQVDFVLFFTGWHEKWNSTDYFINFPTLTKEAVEWLTKFKLNGLGFDTISVDKVASKDLPNHHIILGKEIIIIENLTNLDKLPKSIFSFHCLPLKIENADGSPVRAIAIIEE